MQYPGNWFGGKTRGSLSEKKKTFLARITDPNGKTLSKYFSFATNSEKKRMNDNAKKWLMNESDRLGLTQNKIRYLDKDTIEVELTMDKTFVTDERFLDLVEQYKIHVKKKKEKTLNKDRFYVIAQEKKRAFNFTDLICKYKIVEYIDGDTLNLKLTNLKEFGHVIPKKIVDAYQDFEDDQLQYFSMDITLLPKNVWILGKPAGTVFKRNDNDNIYVTRVSDEKGKQCTKTFNINDYSSERVAKREAIRWQYNTSFKIGTTKNMIRIIDDEFIEVKLTKGSFMITDKIFIPLIQQIPLFCTKSGTGKDPNTYCATSLNKVDIKYHNLITTFNMVDHINHNSLDNRLINLRFCDHSENNRNRTPNLKSIGVRLVELSCGLEAFEARGKFHGKTLTKYFYIKHHGKENAQKLAEKFRKNIYEIDVNSSIINFTGFESIEDLTFYLRYLTTIHDDLLGNVNPDSSEYLKNINITEKQKISMFSKLLMINYWRETNLKYKISVVKTKILGEKPCAMKISLPFSTIYDIKDKNVSFEKENKQNVDEKYMSRIIKLKNGKLITTRKYITSANSVIKIECEKDHLFEMTYSDLKKGKWCYSCNNSRGEFVVRKTCEKIFDKQFKKIRPDWLKNKTGCNLELDIYNDELKLAFEYNGLQHYEFNKYFYKSEQDFEMQKERDKLKEKICKECGIVLIIIPHTILEEDIYDHILEQLDENDIDYVKPKSKILIK